MMADVLKGSTTVDGNDVRFKRVFAAHMTRRKRGCNTGKKKAARARAEPLPRSLPLQARFAGFGSDPHRCHACANRKCLPAFDPPPSHSDSVRKALSNLTFYANIAILYEDNSVNRGIR